MGKKAKARKAKPKKGKGASGTGAKMSFTSAPALFRHLESAPRNLEVNCKVFRIENDARRVMITAAGNDWWAVPTARVTDAQPLGMAEEGGRAFDAKLSFVASAAEHEALAPLLAGGGAAAAGAHFAAPAIPPPPQCPGFARWTGDRWVCL